MIIPLWVQATVDRFDEKTEPHNEIEIAQAISNLRSQQGDLDNEDCKGFLAEHSAFFFQGSREDVSVWGTYFGPRLEATSGTSTTRVPDIVQLDTEIVAYWEQRAGLVKNPLMKARYADAAWDLKNVIAKTRPDYQCALRAIDGYLEATDRHFYKMEIEGVYWLVRALCLAREVNNAERIAKVVDEMFAFYQASLQPRMAGIWALLFDNLYGEKRLIFTSQEAQIISDFEAMLSRLTVVEESNEFDPFGAQVVAECLVKHYKKQGDTANVKRVMKAYSDAFVVKAEKISPLLAMTWLQPIIERYEQEGMSKEAEEVRLLQIKKSENIDSEMKRYAVEVKVTKKDFDDLVSKLMVKNDLKKTLMNVAGYFIPSADRAREGIQELKKVAPFMSTLPIINLDQTGRPIARIGTDDDSEGRLFQQLAQTVAFRQPFLSYVVKAVIAEFQPSVDDILVVLYRSPLFLENRRSILQAGLAAYLSKDHLKAIHVLVPQIEEMLRTLLVIIGIPPYKSVPRHPGIADVKNMSDALSDPRVQEVLTENIWKYLTVLYIDKRGINLRNDLAHGLVSLETFNQSTSDVVLHSLLVLNLLRKKERASSE